MRINKTTASDYALQNMSKNLSFQALKVEKNALKGFGVRGSKKLLKNINSLDELASRADVFIKKGDKIGNKLVSAPFIANMVLSFLATLSGGLLSFVNPSLGLLIGIGGALSFLAGHFTSKLGERSCYSSKIEVKNINSETIYEENFIPDSYGFQRAVYNAIGHLDKNTEVSRNKEVDVSPDKKAKKFLSKNKLKKFIEEQTTKKEGFLPLHKNPTLELLRDINANITDPEIIRKIHLTKNKFHRTPLQELWFSKSSEISGRTAAIAEYLSAVNDNELRKELVLDEYEPNSSIFTASYVYWDSSLKKLMKNIFGDEYLKVCSEHPQLPPEEHEKFVKEQTTPDENGCLPLHKDAKLIHKIKYNIFDLETLRKIHLARDNEGRLPLDVCLCDNFTHDSKRRICKQYLDTILYPELKEEIVFSEDEKGESIFSKYRGILGPKILNLDDSFYKAKCKELDMRELNKSLEELTSKTKSSKLSIEDLQEFQEKAKEYPEIIEKFHTTEINGELPIYYAEDEEFVRHICKTLPLNVLHNILKAKPSNSEIPYGIKYSNVDEVKNLLIKYRWFGMDDPATSYYKKSLSKIQNNLDFFIMSKDELNDAFTYLSFGYQEQMHEILTTEVSMSDGSKTSRINAFIMLNPNEFPLDRINKIYASEPEKLGKIYLEKYENSTSVLETLMKEPNVNSKNIIGFLDIIQDKPELLKTALSQINSSRKSNSTGENDTIAKDFESKIYEYKVRALKDQGLISTSLDFADINDIKAFLKVCPASVNSLVAPDGSSLICKIADIQFTKENQAEYLEMIKLLKAMPNIDYNKQDAIGIPFVEKVMHAENPFLLDLIQGKTFDYYPVLDKAYERISNEDFKKLVDENVNFRFRDIEEACRLNSTKALDKLEPQFKSPLFNDRNQKEILLMAAKTNREFATKLALYYSECFSPASMDVFKTILAKKL